MTSDQRRAAIVNAAVQLFSQTGFRGATTRQLAAAVGVSEPVLYMHFETKRDLYSAIIEKLACGGPDGAIDRVLAKAGEADDDEGFFFNLAKSMIQWHEEAPERIRILLFSALEGHELSELFFQRHVVPFWQAFAGYIQSRTEEGAYRDIDPVLAARLFCGMVGQYAMSIVVFGHPQTEELKTKTLKTMVDIFLKGVRKSESL